MKLFIKREQKAQTGFLGGNKGVTFYLSYRIELTPEEKALVEKYKEEIILFAFTRGRTKGHDTKEIPNPKDVISNLMQGFTESGEVRTMHEDERTIKEGCSNFKVLLNAEMTYGGEEVVDF
jgi:hypothetical protein